nr:cation:dicarboxylase symporter family transporter [Burkholderia gladioli]
MSELDTALPILTVNCARIAPPAGHYSHVCVAAGLAHVSGQLPVSAASEPRAARPFAEQVRQVLANLDGCLAQAGVTRAALVVVVAILPMFHLPEAGLLLVMGIDQFFDMGRTATNVLGNSIATAVLAKWEGELGPRVEPGQGQAEAEAANPPELAQADVVAPVEAQPR